MKAIILAAGVGRRLYGDDSRQPPKSLLRFGGKTLMRRHVETLADAGVDGIAVVVGFEADAVLAEARASAPPGLVTGRLNPRFREGSVVSLWTAQDVLLAGDDILFMDADVLYHRGLVERLVSTPHANCFLLDGDLEAGDEPVRLCLKGGWAVDIGKSVEGDFDVVGEWPGLMRLEATVARRLAEACVRLVEGGRADAPYEDALREVLTEAPPGTFGVEDVSDLPWIEIDFPRDLERARRDVLPRIEREG